MFDQLMSVYSRYQVMSSKITVSVRVDNSSIGQVMTVFPANTSTPAATAYYAAELPFSKMIHVTSRGSGPNVRSITSTSNAQALVGRVISSVNYTGTAGANPSSLVYWHIQHETEDASTILGGDVAVSLEYTCFFYDRQTVGAS
jgi:hypothetical protein